jgi:hypothetical protein
MACYRDSFTYLLTWVHSVSWSIHNMPVYYISVITHCFRRFLHATPSPFWSSMISTVKCIEHVNCTAYSVAIRSKIVLAICYYTWGSLWFCQSLELQAEWYPKIRSLTHGSGRATNGASYSAVRTHLKLIRETENKRMNINQRWDSG